MSKERLELEINKIIKTLTRDNINLTLSQVRDLKQDLKIKKKELEKFKK